MTLYSFSISRQMADVSESPPKNLYLTAAILIREGFIALEDLYPHVSSLLILTICYSSRRKSSYRPMMPTWTKCIKIMRPRSTREQRSVSWLWLHPWKLPHQLLHPSSDLPHQPSRKSQSSHQLSPLRKWDCSTHSLRLALCAPRSR
jgi:hypothetical protein